MHSSFSRYFSFLLFSLAEQRLKLLSHFERQPHSQPCPLKIQWRTARSQITGAGLTQQWAPAAQKANHVLGHAKNRSREVILPLSLLPPGLLHPGLGLPMQEGCEAVGVSPEEDTQMMRGMEHLSSGDRLEEFSFQPFST